MNLAHKDATTVCPPPLLDPFVSSGRIAYSDLETTAGCYSAGAQIDGRAVILYVPKRGRVLINEEVPSTVVLNVEATDGLPRVVYESVGRIVSQRSSLRIAEGEDKHQPQSHQHGSRFRVFHRFVLSLFIFVCCQAIRA